MPQIEVSPGELIDRLSILTIKSERLTDPGKLKRVNAALSSLLVRVAETFGAHHQSQVWPLYERLKAANMAIWDAQEELRIVNWDDDRAVAVQSRLAHRGNDERFRLKRKIDALMAWATSEEKSYL